MEKVAAKGGWEEAEETMKLMAKIKPAAWKAMGETILDLKTFTEASGIEGFLDNLKETWDLKVQEALSPLTNEVSELINTALKPIMPAITAALNEATIFVEGGVKAWTAIITGQWDEYFVWLSAHISDDFKTFKNDFNEWLYSIKKDIDNFFGTWDRMWRGFVTEWETFWSDPLGAIGGAVGIDPGLQQTFDDIGGAIAAGWSGFWSDTGLF